MYFDKNEYKKYNEYKINLQYLKNGFMWVLGIYKFCNNTYILREGISLLDILLIPFKLIFEILLYLLCFLAFLTVPFTCIKFNNKHKQI